MLLLFQSKPRTQSCSRFSLSRPGLVFTTSPFLSSLFFSLLSFSLSFFFFSVLWMAAVFQLCRSPQEFVAGISWLIHRLRPVTHPSCTSFWTRRHCCLSLTFVFVPHHSSLCPFPELGSLKFLWLCLCCNHETRAVSEFYPQFCIFSLSCRFGRFRETWFSLQKGKEIRLESKC